MSVVDHAAGGGVSYTYAAYACVILIPNKEKKRLKERKDLEGCRCYGMQPELVCMMRMYAVSAQRRDKQAEMREAASGCVCTQCVCYNKS
jgi:hypothetical protein